LARAEASASVPLRREHPALTARATSTMPMKYTDTSRRG
jgi:hypothetical protein